MNPRGEHIMTTSRRTFLAGSAAVGAGMIAALPAGAAFNLNPSGTQGTLKLSCQEWLIPGKTLDEKLDKMEAWGFVGIEPGGKDLHKRVSEFDTALKNRSIRISAICAGFDGVPVSEFANQRRRAMDSMKRILEAAGQLKSTGLIFVPAFNSQSQIGPVAGRFLLVDFLREIADFAQKAGTRMLLEPLNRNETWYIRQLADAARICQEINHPAICMMGDFYHMGLEEPCEYSAFLSCRQYVHHVHLASRPARKQPGFDAGDDFRPGFKALKEIGYQDYCSYECSIDGKPEEVIPKMVDFIRKQWEEA